MTLSMLKNLWYQWWFKPESPAPLCMFRIIYGILLFLSTLMLLPEYRNYYGPLAFVSEHSAEIYHGPDHFSLLFLLPRSDFVVSCVLFALLLSSVGLIVGLRSRTCAMVAFVCLTSLHHRNPFIMNSGDTLLRIFAFLLMFSPCGALYALDNKSAPGTQVLARPWAQRLIQLQVAALYCQAFWCKAMGQDWIDGTAVFYATHLVEYRHFPVPFLLDNLFISKLLTWGTLVIEFSLWSLIWIKDLRYYVLAAGVALHLGIEWSMNIPLFEFIAMASFLTFVKPDDVERAVSFCRSMRLSRAQFRFIQKSKSRVPV